MTDTKTMNALFLTVIIGGLSGLVLAGFGLGFIAGVYA